MLQEFQSGVDWRMALRALTDTGLAWEGLLRRGERYGDDTPPMMPLLSLVIPLVLYNGASPWTASVDVSKLVAAAALAILHRLRAALVGPELEGLRQSFAEWTCTIHCGGGIGPTRRFTPWGRSRR